MYSYPLLVILLIVVVYLAAARVVQGVLSVETAFKEQP